MLLAKWLSFCLGLHALFLRWINFHPNMDTQLHPVKSVGWSCLSIPKLQRCHRWRLGMDKQFHPTLYWACDYLSMLRLELNVRLNVNIKSNISKRGPRFTIGSLTYEFLMPYHYVFIVVERCPAENKPLCTSNHNVRLTLIVHVSIHVYPFSDWSLYRVWGTCLTYTFSHDIGNTLYAVQDGIGKHIMISGSRFNNMVYL